MKQSSILYSIRDALRSHPDRFASALLLSAVAVLFANVINAGFVYDDANFIVENTPIKTWLFTRPWDFFLKPEVAVWSGIYRPLRTLSFAIDYQFFGLNPIGYHVENIVIHALNVLLVYYILRKLLTNRTACFLAALMFAVHPIQLEAVSWISSRGDLLFALFSLIGLRWYISFTRRDGISWKAIAGWMTVYVLGLLSKETAIVLFPIILCYDLFIVCSMKKEPLITILKKRWLFYSVLFVVTISYLTVRFNIFESVSQKPFWGGSVQANFLTMLEATLYYFKLIVYPVDLSIDYSTYPIIYSFADTRLILPMIFYLSAAGICFIEWRRRNYRFLFFAAVAVLFLLPSWNIFPISAIIAERFMYGSMIGLSAIAGCVLTGMLSMATTTVALRTVLVTLFTLCLCFMTLAVFRNHHWRTNFQIWKECLEVFPGNYKGHINLGTEYDKRDEYYNALMEYFKLISIKPYHAKAYYNMGNIYWKLGLFEQSRDAFLTALHYNPQYWEAMNNLGSLYIDKMWYEEAERIFLKLLNENPDYAKAHFNLAQIYFMRFKDYPKAKYHLKKCIESDMFRRSTKVHYMLRKIQIIERETLQKQQNSSMPADQREGLPR